ncbi:hypothetical protein H310_14928 [Aphanomyces invadans]|uniref:Uncharacterized protein n=1 Tax=Aphanomyces invadans TaxID=157072 RepID=A0A024T857_9STRA|nr:hypothetical protein H310_14928 [Aphanomyces invadans]ETV90250.1 hypothetical protein H310_14928 [Aphanomyces invadans]|eukprot:XP_008881125.1 hypothetical protein H310_14928 [Aphanomyces invadans]
MASTALVMEGSMDVDAAVESLRALKLGSDMATSLGRSKAGGFGDGHDHPVCLREHYEAMMVDQAHRAHLTAQENTQLRSMLATMEGQNQALRHTVHALEGYRDKAEAQEAQIDHLQREIKHLKQSNYSLQVYLQQMDHARSMSCAPRPPDVY